MGDVVGAKCSSRLCFGGGGGDRFGSVFTDQPEQFGDLARQRTVGFGQALQVGFEALPEQGNQSQLGTGALRGRAVFGQGLSKRSAPNVCPRRQQRG